MASVGQKIRSCLLDGLRNLVAVVNYVAHRMKDNTLGQSARNIEGIPQKNYFSKKNNYRSLRPGK